VSNHDLANGVGTTFPFETFRSIRVVATSPDGRLIVAIDESGRAVVASVPRRLALHHFSFKGPVRCARFSPDGKWLAVAVGRLVQVWAAPPTAREPSPMHLHRTYGQAKADVVTLAWSHDSQWLAAGSKDLATRVFSLNPIEGYQVPTLFGHKDRTVGAFFVDSPGAPVDKRVSLVTVSRDGAVFLWGYERDGAEGGGGGGGGGSGGEGSESEGPEGSGGEGGAGAPRYAGGRWRLQRKEYFHQSQTRTEACDLHVGTGMLVAGFSTGVFGVYNLGDGLAPFQELHVLSVSRAGLSTAAFDATGEWVALGCASLGQLLVWEWRSETYVLKQQGHFYDVACAAYSPDGGTLVTGADDAKVKVWDTTSGSCFVTFTEHTAPVSAVAFLPSGTAFVSASLDGTARAFDLVRYRNFRTMTTPQAVQFASLAVDPSGDVVCAGARDTFQVYVFALRTGQLLDVLAAHEGPAVGLSFNPTKALLASASWDKTVRLWDVFSGNKVATETLQHSHDVLAVCHSPTGKELCCSTLDGQLHFWDVEAATLRGSVDGRLDIAGGRLPTDRRAAGNSSSGKCFTSLAYSADGSFLIGAGSSKFVCVYDVAERVLLARFQVSHNRSLAGVLDELNSKNMTDGGPLDLIDDAGSDDDDPEALALRAADPSAASALPGTASKGAGRAVVRSRCLALSPTGRQWCACTTEGVLVYSLDEAAAFDPTDLDEDITPAACRRALAAGQHLRALLLSLRLGDPDLTERCIMETPPREIAPVALDLPAATAPKVLAAVAAAMPASPHLEFLLLWIRSLGVAHGEAIRAMPRHVTSAAVRAALHSVNAMHTDLQRLCEGNLWALAYAGTAVGAAAGQAAGDGAAAGAAAENGAGGKGGAKRKGGAGEGAGGAGEAAGGGAEEVLVSVGGGLRGSRILGEPEESGSEEDEDWGSGQGGVPGWGAGEEDSE